jgi:hypothetical protein
MNQCNEPDHGAINAERAESRGLRKAWVELDDKRQDLEKQLSTITEQRDRLLEEREQWRLSSICRIMKRDLEKARIENDWLGERLDKMEIDKNKAESERDLWKAEAERWREAAEESFQTRAWKQLIEEEKNRMRSRLEYMVGEDWGSKLSKSE